MQIHNQTAEPILFYQQTNPRTKSPTVRYRCFICCSSNCCYLFLLVSNCWTLQCLTAGHWDLNFHHGRHGNALGLLRLSLRESSSLRSSVNLTTSSQANLRDTEMVTKIRFALFDR